MSIRELKQIKAKVDFLLSNSLDDVNDYNYIVFYELLTDKLQTALRTEYQPYPVFRKQKTHYKKLVELVDYLDELLLTIFKAPKKLYYRKIYRIYIALVMDVIQQASLPLELPVILNFKSKFPAVLDNAFPGYLENGLIRVIFSKKI